MNEKNEINSKVVINDQIEVGLKNLNTCLCPLLCLLGEVVLALGGGEEVDVRGSLTSM